MKHTSGKFEMNTWLKKMMIALLALGIGQAAWADDTLNVGEVAQKEMLQLAEAGDAELQFSLGVMYEHGEGVRQDYAEAARWYRKAAEQGQAEAQYNLCMMYYVGQGVNQDHEQAMEWCRSSADKRYLSAQKFSERAQKAENNDTNRTQIIRIPIFSTNILKLRKQYFQPFNQI